MLRRVLPWMLLATTPVGAARRVGAWLLVLRCSSLVWAERILMRNDLPVPSSTPPNRHSWIQGDWIDNKKVTMCHESRVVDVQTHDTRVGES